MRLTPEEERMRQGEMGPAVRDAIELQIKVGEFWGAERFVPITNAHMMGDIEVMGEAGKGFLERLTEMGGHCRTMTSTNARCVDFAFADRLKQNPAEVGKEHQVIRFLRDLNVTTVDTCINYQTVYQPHLGEHVAWGDTGTVIYANSVFGARTNFEGGPVALAAAMTGRTPEYGFHLDEHRRGSFIVELDLDLDDYADWGAIGKLVGEPNQNYFSVPVFTGVKRTPTSDELKHLGAALASYGSMAMFHMVGVTPEARTLEEALGGRKPTHTMKITRAELDAIYAGFKEDAAAANLFVFSAPQQSIYEMKRLAELFTGRRVKPGTTVIVTTSHGVKSQAEPLGYVQTLQEAGVLILEGVCFYILQNLPQMRVENGWSNLVTNSAKLANIIKAHKFNPILRRTGDCVAAATLPGAQK
jgi:predicted aconitase